MLSASYAFHDAIEENSKVIASARLHLSNGTQLDLTGDDFMMGGLSFTQATSTSGAFSIGSAVVGSCSLKLNNHDGRFDEYDFTDAVIIPRVGIGIDGKVEWVVKGTYRIEQPSTYGSVISLACTDNLSLFKKPLSDVEVRYPIVAPALAEIICQSFGVSMRWVGPNDDYMLEAAPEDDITCLDALSYIAQATGHYVKCDPRGAVVFDWYDVSDKNVENVIDGGELDESSPYSTGGNADGGNFIDYSSGDTVEGGEFGIPSFVYMHAFSSLDIGTDDIVVTGVRVTACDKPSQGDSPAEEGETVLEGAEGYVLEIEDNPFIPFGKAFEVSKRIGPSIVGMRFRPFTASAIGNPLVEAGDRACLIDAQQHRYATYVTACTYRVGSYESYSCEAEPPARNSAASSAVSTKTYRETKKLIAKERTARETALRDLADTLANSSGLYMSKLQQPDGSVIYFMHDKPTVGESKIVWKLTAEAMGISTDGGRTYPYGFDVSGKAILDRIYALGLDATYITTGTLDASAVTIKNLMRIGDESNGVNISKNSVSIRTIDGNVLNMSAVPYAWVSKSFTNNGGPIKPDATSTIPGGRQWATYHLPFDNGNVYMDENHVVSWNLSITGYYDGQIFHIAKSGDTVMSPSQQGPYIGYTYYGEETFGEIKDFGAGSEPWIRVTFNALPDERVGKVKDIPTVLQLAKMDKDNYITSVKLSMKHAGTNGEISSKDETFLTDKNFTALANGGELWSGTISIPYFFNNVARNYVLYFQDGLLKEFNILTTSDDGFKPY